MVFQDVKNQCDSLGGYLPRFVKSNTREQIEDNTWLALKSDLDSVKNCNSVSKCIQTGIKFYWYGSNIFEDEPLTTAHDSYFGQMEVDDESPCFYLKGDKVKDKPCDHEKKGVCIISYDNLPAKSNAVPKDYSHTEFVCDTPDPPPGNTLLQVDSEQPNPMCIGDKARYKCNAGGVNVRGVSQFQ